MIHLPPPAPPPLSTEVAKTKKDSQFSGSCLFIFSKFHYGLRLIPIRSRNLATHSLPSDMPCNPSQYAGYTLHNTLCDQPYPHNTLGTPYGSHTYPHKTLILHHNDPSTIR